MSLPKGNIQSMINSPDLGPVPSSYQSQYYSQLPYGYPIPPFSYHPELTTSGKGEKIPKFDNLREA